MQFPQPIHMHTPYAPFPTVMPCTPQYPWAPGPPNYNAVPMMPPNCNPMHLMPQNYNAAPPMPLHCNPMPPMPPNYNPMMHRVSPSPCYHDPRFCCPNMRLCAGNSESLHE